MRLKLLLFGVILLSFDLGSAPSNPTRPAYSFNEPVIVDMIIQQQLRVEEPRYYDWRFIKEKKIKTLTNTSYYTHQSENGEKIGNKITYEYDTAGNIKYYRQSMLIGKNYKEDRFIYDEGKLTNVVCSRFREDVNVLVTDTFSAVYNEYSMLLSLIPISKSLDHCVPTYWFNYDYERKLTSVLRTHSCMANDTAWRILVYDSFRHVMQLTEKSRSGNSEKFFAYDRQGNNTEIIEVQHIGLVDPEVILSTMSYNTNREIQKKKIRSMETGGVGWKAQKLKFIYSRNAQKLITRITLKMRGLKYFISDVVYEYY